MPKNDLLPKGTSSQDSLDTLNILASANIGATWIGKMVKRDKGLKLIKEEETLPLPVFHQDELSKIVGRS